MIIRTTLVVPALLVVFAIGVVNAQGQAPPVAKRAQEILEKDCSSAGCHGSVNPQKGINVTRREVLITTKVVVPKASAKSRLIEVVESGFMPFGGQKLADADIQALKDWIDAGAPDWIPPNPPAKRTLVKEADTLRAIIRDLEAANERDRPFYRYVNSANLHNNPEVSDRDLQLYRTSLSKLLNSLSWEREIARPKAIDAQQTILRIDLRDFSWSPAIWQKIIAAYPYGLKPRALSGEIRQIYALSGAELPYVRVDWFVAFASIPPLYHEILQLPDNVRDLEKKLGVNVEQNRAQDRAARAGVRNSGVSRHNRAVELHRSRYGAYGQSFDYASGRADKNIFIDPINLRPDGSEFIFHLPNGLQAYMIANAQGKRLDAAPIEIVSDRTNPDDRRVVNGRSCIGCHFEGMNRFQNEVRRDLEARQRAHFDLDKALALYVKQEELDRLFAQDMQQFQAAVRATGSEVPKNASEEPINKLSQRYFADLTVAQAAADAGLDEKEFQRRVNRSSRLEKLGFNQLLEPNGGIKRDSWEESFGVMVAEIGLGDFLKPTFLVQHQAVPSDKRTISIGTLTGQNPQLAQRARQALLFYLNQSDDLRVVAGNADYNLRGALIVKARDEVTIQVSEPQQNLREEASGSPSDLHFMAQQIASRINQRLSGNTLRVGAALDPAQQIQQVTTSQGAVNILLTVDRGPGSTYRFGEKVQVLVKVDRDCFLTLYNVDSQGNVNLLFPNQFTRDNRVQAGRVYTIPDPQEPWEIEVGGVPGIEIVSAVATLTPVALPGQESGRPEVGVVSKSLDGFSKSLTAQLKNQPAQSGGGASTATVRFFTVK